jgi:ubiquinone biosynthesis protein COQ4
MAAIADLPGLSTKRDWRSALDALKALLNDGDDTVQVFRIMRALNAGNTGRNYNRLLKTTEGGQIASDQIELSGQLMSPAVIASFEAGTVGAAYRSFLENTGFSADGLVEVGNVVNTAPDLAHPYAWFGRRERDIHDIWHILTGYQANDQLGEACLVAFSYAQSKGLGWAVIAVGAALKSFEHPSGKAARKAIWEGYRNGRAAGWLHGEDYMKLLAEPLTAARWRLNIPEPVEYLAARAEIGSENLADPRAAMARH